MFQNTGEIFPKNEKGEILFNDDEVSLMDTWRVKILILRIKYLYFITEDILCKHYKAFSILGHGTMRGTWSCEINWNFEFQPETNQ